MIYKKIVTKIVSRETIYLIDFRTILEYNSQSVSLSMCVISAFKLDKADKITDYSRCVDNSLGRKLRIDFS